MGGFTQERPKSFSGRHMMVKLENEQVRDLNDWFIRYVQGFKNDPATVRNIVLKEEHTKRVCREIIAIGTDLGLTNDELHFAEIIALFHDIGRFEQYARYKTFVDRRSEDHAELGVTVLRRLGVLHRCGEATQDIVFRIIRYHNRAALPREETEPCLFFRNCSVTRTNSISGELSPIIIVGKTANATELLNSIFRIRRGFPTWCIWI